MTGLLVDYFAGGGGASTALERAFGRKVDIAINHDAEALAMHAANHPDTYHVQEDVFKADIAEIIAERFGNQPIDGAWFSPDCTHHSRAKGGKPVDNKRRGLAWVVLRVAALPQWQRPRVIFLENVPEFADWGPLDKKTMKPIKEMRGQTFALWRSHLEALGYRVEHKVMVAADYGAPTTRKRLFLVARNDGLPIVWPKPTHFNPKAKRKKGQRPPAVRLSMAPWRTAAECIDFSVPSKSIFDRPKPLAPATLERIRRGLVRYVLENPNPFIIPLTHHGERRQHELSEPFPTITCANRGELAFVEPFIAGVGGRAGQTLERSTGEPLNTLTTKADQIIVAPVIASIAHGDSGGRREYPIDNPLGTVTGQGVQHAVVSAHITKFRTGATGHELNEPLHTITANSFEVRPGGAAPLGLVEVTMVPFVARVDMASAAGRNGIHGLDEPVRAITTAGPFAVIEAQLAPFLAGVTQSSTPRLFDITNPLPVITTAKGGELVVVEPILAPVLVQTGYGERKPTYSCGSCGLQFEDDYGTGIGTLCPVECPKCAEEDDIYFTPGQAPRALDIEAPLGTVISDGNKFAVAAAYMLTLKGSDRRDRAVDWPLGAVCAAGQHHAVIAVHFNVGRNSQKPWYEPSDPTHTIVADGAHHNLVAAYMAQFSGTTADKINAGHSVDKPLSAIVGKGPLQAIIEVPLTQDELDAGSDRCAAFLTTYFGNGDNAEPIDRPMRTVTTKDRFSLVTVMIKGVPYRIYDIRMRMLKPRELFNAQGFPADYQIFPMVPPTATEVERARKKGREPEPKRMSVGSSIAKCGNSVSPPPAIALAVANAPPMSRLQVPEEATTVRRRRRA